MIKQLILWIIDKIIRNVFQDPDGNRELYYSHPNLEIVLFAHDALSKVAPRHENEVLIVRNAWYPRNIAGFTKKLRKKMGKPNNSIYYLSNTEEIHQQRLKWYFNSHFININCFIDESIFKPDPSQETKLYDAVAIARFSWCGFRELKRHYLMSEIESLALLDPVSGTTDQKYKRKYCSRENCKYYNQNRLSPQEVVRILQLSHCGLILSEHEGACRASCEYLSVGLPVVSTPSVGGRDVWFDDYNSMIVEPDPTKIKEAVEYFKHHPRDQKVIRSDFLKKAQVFRDRFKNQVIAPILQEHNIEMSADEFLKENPFFWWPLQLKKRKMGTSHVVLEFQEFDIGNISPKLINYILTNVKSGSNILEFGSGLSSRELSKAYNVISIEHNPKFMNLFHQQYIYSELQKKDLHYREEDCLKALSMHNYDVILIDGPPAYRRNTKKSRLGFQKYVNKLSKHSIIIFDDVHRFWDCVNLIKTYLKLKREVILINEGKKRSAVLTLNPSNSHSSIKLAYLLYKSLFYIYDDTTLYFILKLIKKFKKQERSNITRYHPRE